MTESQRELGGEAGLGICESLPWKIKLLYGVLGVMGEIMQDSSVREMFGRAALCWIAQALGLVWEQDGLCRRWQNKARRERGANQTGKKYEKEEAEKRGERKQRENGSSNMGTM